MTTGIRQSATDASRAGVWPPAGSHFRHEVHKSCRLRGISVERNVVRSVMEHSTAAIVQECFGGCPLGQQHVVTIQLDMMVVDLGQSVLLGDTRAVCQLPGRDQQPVQEHRVFWRDEKVTARQPLAQRTGTEADRPGTRIGRQEAARETAAADPPHAAPVLPRPPLPAKASTTAVTVLLGLELCVLSKVRLELAAPPVPPLPCRPVPPPPPVAIWLR